MQIIRYPHPTLRHKSKPLCRVDAELKRLVCQMFELMYHERGIGLAANQVDLPYRLFILNLESDPEAKDEEHVFINPVISRRKGSDEESEGCLSFPGICAPVKRSKKIVLNAYTLGGEEVSFEMEGLFARAVQHEADHLDGSLFIDRLGPTSRLEVNEELLQLHRTFDYERAQGRIPDDTAIAARLNLLEAART